MVAPAAAPVSTPVSEAAVSRQVPPAHAGAVTPAADDQNAPDQPALARQPRSMADSLTAPMARTGTDAGRRGARTAMPSWDDVLLGGSRH